MPSRAVKVLLTSLVALTAIAAVVGLWSSLPRPAEHGMGEPVGVATYRVKQRGVDRERLAIFDAKGRAHVCLSGKDLRVHLVTEQTILFEDSGRARGDVYEIDVSCSAEPHLFASASEISAGRFISCLSRGPDERFTLLVDGSEPNAFRSVGAQWQPIYSIDSCTWLTDTHLFVAADDLSFGYGSAFAVDARTGQLAFFRHPRRWNGIVAPDGMHSFGNDKSGQRIVNMASGAIIRPPPLAHDVWPTWSPTGRRLLSDGEGDGPTRVFDLRAGLIYSKPSSFWRTHVWLTDTLLVHIRPQRMEIIDLESDVVEPIALPDFLQGRFHNPHARGFTPLQRFPAVELLAPDDVARIRLPGLALEVPLPSGWKIGRCRRPGCRIAGYRMDHEIHSPTYVFTDDKPLLGFGRTNDAVSHVIRRLSQGSSERCDEDDVDCWQADVGRTRLDGRTWTTIERVFYEYFEKICLTHWRQETIMITGSCPTDDEDLLLDFILDELRLVS